VAFEAETLGFLPRAPVLLKFGAPEARVAELRLARDERAGQDDDLVGRRIGVS
jgi:hypothetical protein